MEQGDEKTKNLPFGKKIAIQIAYLFDNGTFAVIPTPFSSDNAFFFQKTEGYNEIGKKSF